MTAYYNEIDPYCCEWLHNLMDAGAIPAGRIDNRSITDVSADDVRHYAQCHFFAGCGGWPLAMRLAGWADARPVWSGSCPCQPFSSAGKRQGRQDERHLWPEFYRLIRECRPETVFGEQVASSAVVGTELEAAFIDAVQRGDYAKANRCANRLVKSGSLGAEPRWLDGISADLEAVGYTIGAVDLPAAGVGAPHIRQRVLWVANSKRRAAERQRFDLAGEAGGPEDEVRQQRLRADAGAGCTVGSTGKLGDANGTRLRTRRPQRCECSQAVEPLPSKGSEIDRLARSQINGRDQGRAESDGRNAGAGRDADRLGNRLGTGLEGRAGQPGDDGPQCAAAEQTSGDAWSDFRIVACRDNKTRRVSSQPGDEPLAHGVPRDLGPLLARLAGMGIDPKAARRIVKAARRNRVGRLRAYGNAIVAPLAAEFVAAYEEEYRQPK